MTAASLGMLLQETNVFKNPIVSLNFYYVNYDCLFCIFIMIMPFIRIYTAGVTDINYNEPLVGFLFVLNGLLYNLKTPQGMLVISAGMYKETRIQTTIQGAIVVILGLALTPFIGIYGVLIASILSNLYRDIDLMFFIPKNVTKLPVVNTVKRMLIVIVTTFIICTSFTIDISPNGYIQYYKCCFRESLHVLLLY